MSSVPTLDRIERELLAALRDRLVDSDVALEATTPLADVGLDSLAVMQLLILVEESFGVWLPESGLTRAKLRDVRSLAAVVAEHLATGSGEAAGG